MNGTTRDLFAGEYVLGTLDAETRRRVRQKLSEDPALQQAVRSWEERLSPLSEGERPIDPPVGLWNRIDSVLDDTDGFGFATTIRGDEGHWQPLVAGVEKKVLHVDRVGGHESFLLRLAPGACVPGHPHSMTEECLMLEGEVSIGDLHLKAGDYHVVSAKTTHPELSSERGGLLYVRSELREASG